jgi:dTDP-glucose 4,6-dehydratase
VSAARGFGGVASPPRRLRRAVVTGGAGFLGSHLCEALLAREIDVVCLDNFLTGMPENVAHLVENPRFRLVRCDVSEFVHVPGPVDLVLHFASPASPADYLRMPIETLKVGSLGTLHTLGLAREKGARYVLASTSEVYGDPLEHPQAESYWGNVNPVGPRGVYDEAKRFSEALTTAYRLRRGTDTGIVRIFNTYGPRLRPGDGRAIPTFMAQALAGEPLTVAGDGSQTRSVCYVDDTVAGVLALALSGEPDPVNIGNPREISMLDLARRIVDLTGSSSEISFVPLPEDDPKVRRPDTTRARELLGWEPVVDLDDGLRRTLRWFAEAQSVSAAS